MVEAFVLLFICTYFAGLIEQTKMRSSSSLVQYNNYNDNGRKLLYLLLIILIWFSGTRTRMNDTAAYMRAFRDRIPATLDGLSQIKWNIGSYPLFQVYNIVIKTLISDDPQVFILISAAIVVSSMVLFLYRYSWDFGKSIYLFISFTVYGFTMAAMKQTMATAIAIWMVPCLQQKKYLRLLMIMVFSVLVHPYVIVLFVACFLYNKDIWDTSVIFLIGITLIIGVLFSAFTSLLFRLTSIIGQDYEENWEIAKAGVGIARVIFNMITPVLSYLYRDKIRNNGQPLFNLSINMSIVAMCFSIISRFGGAVLFGRIPEYFGLFVCLALPYVLYCADLDEENDQGKYMKRDVYAMSSLSTVTYSLYLFYYFRYYYKFMNAYNVSIWESVYNRIPIWRLIWK